MVHASRRKKIGAHALLIIGSLIMIMPFLWMVSTSFKSFTESMQVPPTIFPKGFKFQNYLEVFEKINFAQYYLNTMIITAARTAFQLILCSLAAYAFARLRFPGKNIIFITILSVLMVPSQVIMIPSFVIMRELGWIDTFYAIIVPGIFSAFGTFLLRQFFMAIPKELDEAAKIDGCSFFGIYWRIILPLSKPALVSLAIFTILASWNDFLWPLIVTNSDEMRVLSIGIATFQGQYATDYPLLMAGALMATAPMIVIFLFLQKYFIEGIALSGVKG